MKWRLISVLFTVAMFVQISRENRENRVKKNPDMPLTPTVGHQLNIGNYSNKIRQYASEEK